MRTLLTLSILFTALISTAGAQTADQIGPGDILAQFHAALADQDAETAKRLSLPSLLIFESGRAEHGFAEYAEHHLEADMAFSAQMTDTILEQDVHVQGEIAWIVTEKRSRGIWRDQALDLFGIETAILQRTSNGWRIAHFHWSSRNAEPTR